MIAFALYVVTALAAASGICGHPPLLPRLARSALARRPQRASAVSRDAEDATEPHSGRTGPRWARQPHDCKEVA